jgi:hypothetical protein
MKAYMPVLVLGLVTFLTGTSAAQSGQFFADGAPVGSWNPCSPPFTQAVIVTGRMHLVYHQNGGHVVAHLNYEGSGPLLESRFQYVAQSDAAIYTASIKADAQLDGGSSLNVPYTGSFVGPAGASSFKVRGMVQIFVTNGVPTGAFIPGPPEMVATCPN